MAQARSSIGWLAFIPLGVKINAPEHMRLMQEYYIQYAMDVSAYGTGKPCFFFQDNAPSHTAKLCKEHYESMRKDLNVHVLALPPSSPDLTPLDYWAWNALKQAMPADTPSLDARRVEIVSGWRKVVANQDETKRTVDAWEKRLKKCLAADGDLFET